MPNDQPLNSEQILLEKALTSPKMTKILPSKTTSAGTAQQASSTTAQSQNSTAQQLGKTSSVSKTEK